MIPAVWNDPHVIVVSRESVKKDSTGKTQRSRWRRGRSDWVAKYPYKGHTGQGKTKKEAIGDLMLQMAGYVGVEIR
jgi:hypothetical protein